VTAGGYAMAILRLPYSAVLLRATYVYAHVCSYAHVHFVYNPSVYVYVCMCIAFILKCCVCRGVRNGAPASALPLPCCYGQHMCIHSVFIFIYVCV